MQQLIIHRCRNDGGADNGSSGSRCNDRRSKDRRCTARSTGYGMAGKKHHFDHSFGGRRRY